MDDAVFSNLDHHAQTCKITAMLGCVLCMQWADEQLRRMQSQSSALPPEVMTRVAIAVAEHGRDCVVCTEYLSSDEHTETYECMQRVIAEALSPHSRAVRNG